VDAPCTLDQLEAATKKAAVSADVEMTNGIATLVTDRRTAQQDSTVIDLKGTEAELETAAKKGVSAEVVISNGIATTIRDDH
jgi:hypothetical protein